MTNFEPLLTDAEVGEMLHLEAKAVQHLARTGQLPGKKIGRFWRFRRSWIERFLEGENAQQISDRATVAPQRHAN